MFMFILFILIDAGILMFLLNVVNDDSIDFATAAIVGLVTAVATQLLAIGLASVIGAAGVFVAVGISAVLLGIAVSALFGVEIKRSLLIGCLFIVLHIAAGIGLQIMMS